MKPEESPEGHQTLSSPVVGSSHETRLISWSYYEQEAQ